MVVPVPVAAAGATTSEGGTSGCSSGAAWLEVISVACVGNAVACWLLEKQATESQNHKETSHFRGSRIFYYLNSSSELPTEIEGSLPNSLGGAESRGSTFSGS